MAGEKVWWNIRMALRAGVFFLPLLFCVFCGLRYKRSEDLQITALDVGQGDGLYIRTPLGSHYLIDGGSSDVADVGKYRIEPYLESQGVKTLDYVFLSHGDEDHISGIREMLNDQLLGIRISVLVLPPETVLDDALLKLAQEAKAQGTKVVTINAGQQIREKELKLTCLAPADDYQGEIGNASSMVLELSYREFDMLFTGDLEGEGEMRLTDGQRLRDYDVLKVAHHGSKNSTTELFLKKAKPEIALISAGRGNRYGHPHEETLQRLQNVGCRIYSTQDCGAVTLKTDGKQISVSQYAAVINNRIK